MRVRSSVVSWRVLGAVQAASTRRARLRPAASFSLANIGNSSSGKPAWAQYNGQLKNPALRRGSLAAYRSMCLLGSAAEWTATLAGALRTLLCFVDAQRPAVHLKAVQGLDGALRLRLGHVDEPEAAGLAGFPVIDQLHRFDFTVTLEQGLHVLFGGI